MAIFFVFAFHDCFTEIIELLQEVLDSPGIVLMHKLEVLVLVQEYFLVFCVEMLRFSYDDLVLFELLDEALSFKRLSTRKFSGFLLLLFFCLHFAVIETAVMWFELRKCRFVCLLPVA